MKQLNETIRPRALLAGVRLNENQDFEVSMKELNNLVKACDMEPMARIDQNLASINAAYYIGSGKVGEIREAVETLRADYVVFNDTLSPSQLKNLQREIDVPVSWRYFHGEPRPKRHGCRWNRPGSSTCCPGLWDSETLWAARAGPAVL